MFCVSISTTTIQFLTTDFIEYTVACPQTKQLSQIDFSTKDFANSNVFATSIDTLSVTIFTKFFFMKGQWALKILL